MNHSIKQLGEYINPHSGIIVKVLDSTFTRVTYKSTEKFAPEEFMRVDKFLANFNPLEIEPYI